MKEPQIDKLESEVQSRLQQLHEEMKEQSELADVGELAGPIFHGFNNFLNILGLHMAVLQQKMPDVVNTDFNEIRQQAAAIAVLVKQLQQYRGGRHLVLKPIDLNSLIRETLRNRFPESSGADPELRLVVETLGHGSASHAGALVALVLARDLPPVLGGLSDLRRLLLFLVANAARASGGEKLTVRTTKTMAGVQLRVEDAGPCLPAESVDRVFDLTEVVRPGTNVLELAACKSLVGRLQGRIACENRTEGGIAMVVELAIAEARI